MQYKIVSRVIAVDGIGEKTEFLRIERREMVDGNPSFVPFDIGNMDARRFVEDWEAGASVEDELGEPLPYNLETVSAMGLAPEDPPAE